MKEAVATLGFESVYAFQRSILQAGPLLRSCLDQAPGPQFKVKLHGAIATGTTRWTGSEIHAKSQLRAGARQSASSHLDGVILALPHGPVDHCVRSGNHSP